MTWEISSCLFKWHRFFPAYLNVDLNMIRWRPKACCWKNRSQQLFVLQEHPLDTLVEEGSFKSRTIKSKMINLQVGYSMPYGGWIYPCWYSLQKDVSAYPGIFSGKKQIKEIKEKYETQNFLFEVVQTLWFRPIFCFKMRDLLPGQWKCRRLSHPGISFLNLAIVVNNNKQIICFCFLQIQSWRLT